MQDILVPWRVIDLPPKTKGSMKPENDNEEQAEN